MPPNNYSNDGMFKTFVEKLLPPVLTYLVRKLTLGLIVALLYMCQVVSNRFGFNLTAEVSDRESWKWEPHKKVPLYRAQLKKVN